MLNNLDTIATALDSHKPSGSADKATLDRARQTCAAVFALLTSAYTNGEDSVSRPGSLRENLEGAFTSLESFPVQGVITPAAAQFYARIDSEYRSARGAYNSFARSIPQVNVELKNHGMKPLPLIPGML